MSFLLRSSPSRAARHSPNNSHSITTTSTEARPQRRKKLRPPWNRLSPRLAHPPGLWVGSPLTNRRLYYPKRAAHIPSMDEDSSDMLELVEQSHCGDIVPHILAFAGPQSMASISQTSKHWKMMVLDDATWRIVCEDLYKWKEGDELPTTSWRQYYQDNPCVPVDYPTLQSALASVSRVLAPEAAGRPSRNHHAPPNFEQTQSVRILLRPATYILREAIVIQAVEGVEVTIETQTLPFSMAHSEISDSPPASSTRANNSSSSPRKRIAQKAQSIRNILTCRTVNPESDVLMHHDDAHTGADDPTLMDPLSTVQSTSDESSPAEVVEPCPISRATLVLSTRRQNEPILRVRQGTINVINVDMVHTCHGMDIWNGNAAVQIQPPLVFDNNQDNRPLPLVGPRPTAVFEKVDILSRSGRGIVNIDGGHLVLDSCHVHDCAATGIYVGGPGSTARICHTDVLRNGMGNKWNRRGIARGHSGIYLEQGRAVVENCNISQNSLTGISAISDSNAILNLERSELVANGTQQLEMPPNGSVARRQSVSRNNTFATHGVWRSRSGLALSEEM